MSSTRNMRRAFTLVEMMVALSLSVVVIMALVSGTIFVRRLCYRQNTITGTTQNLRSAVDVMVRDLRMAGYGMRMKPRQLQEWTPWMSGITNAVLVTPGATADQPDKITIVAAQGQPVMSLKSASVPGDTIIKVQSGSIDAQTKLILIGKCELARIVSISGGNVTISINPSNTVRGLRYAYPVDSTIEAVKVITYTCESGTGDLASRTYLTRNDQTTATTNLISRMIVGDTENLKVTMSSNSIQLRVTVRTDTEDAYWKDPAKNDGYRRKTLLAAVTWRNQY